MFDFLNAEAAKPTPQQIAQSFRWLGWIGLILQSLFGVIPILVLISSVLFRPQQSQWGGFSFGLWMAIACIIILIFSIYWCFRYTRLAHQLEHPDLRPPKAQVIRDLRLGLVANISTMAIAVLISLFRVGQLSFKMLTLPQGSTVIAPNQVGTTVAQGTIIAPSNMIAIQAMVNTIAAGLIGAIIALLLLYQVGQHRNSSEQS
jgi:heme/copper-type cytochrome/quinol oxidase subunit 2